MKNTKKGDLGKALLLGTALVSLSAVEAQAVTATGAMSAVVVAPITITVPTELHFGEISIANATAGTVTVPPDGSARTQTAGVTLLAGAGDEKPGIINIVAATGVNLDVVMAAATYNVTGAGPAMPVNTFLFRDNVAATTAATIDVSITGGATAVTVPVGGTLTTATGALQTAGTYTGAFTVDVTYQ